jgi:hypothetical protein
MYSVYEGDALEDDIAKGRGDDDVDLVVWSVIFVVREIVVLNAITTATTHKNRVAQIRRCKSSCPHILLAQTPLHLTNDALPLSGSLSSLEAMTR